MKKKVLIIIIILCGIIFTLSRMLVIHKPEDTSNKVLGMIREHEFNQLSVYVVGQREVQLTIQDKKEITSLLDLIDIEDDVGLVMSPGTFRLVLYKDSKPLVRFQIVADEYLRHEGGSDYKLSDLSSNNLKQWFAIHGIKAPVQRAEGSINSESSNP